MRSGRREFNYSDNELLKMMAELKVSQSVDLQGLRQSFFTQIKSHHSDKGGDLEKAKNITQAYRVLKLYLESNVLLPQPRVKINPTQQQAQRPSTTGFGARSGCRPGQQAQQSAPDGFQDFGDFQEVKKRRRKRGKGGDGKQNGPQENADTEEEQEEGTSSNGTKMPPKFINGYTYDAEDYSTYDDPMERKDRQKDGIRRIRGGLLLYKDFQRGLLLPPEYQELGTTYTEDDLVDDPMFESILAGLQTNGDDLRTFAEKQRKFVYISWALDGGASHDTRIMLQKVKLESYSAEDDSLYEIKIAKKFDEDVLTTGLHVDVSAHSDGRLRANAVIEQVNPESKTIIIFFVDPIRLNRILSLSHTVNVTINCSAFVYRSQLRSIEYIETARHRNMSQLIFPTPQFTELFEEFSERRAREIQSMQFREDQDDTYNAEQKNAIYSILNKSHHPWPFILFGPPGTGKTITLIEAIRHLVLQSSQNRILICTPSKMAADNFAESLLQQNFLEHKYIFRMHSLSTMAHRRNKKLDPISYMAKETKNRFFGIPDRLNLKMFRVIISTLATSSYLVSAGGLRGYFTHIMLDEAGQALESEAWIPIGGLAGPQTSVILAGDPCQLGPVLNVNSMKYFGFDHSMLKRIMYSDHYKEHCDERVFVILRQTYRSHYSILRPCSYLFYENLLIVDDSQGNFHKLSNWDGLPTKGFPIIFHSSVGSQDEEGPNKSHHNQFEAELVCKYVEQLLKTTNTAEKDIGVIAPYKNQVHKLRHLLAYHPGITVDSVEGFQGSERAVIIMSTVRQKDLGFLRCDLRLNTSISRAKYLLIIIGNEKLLSQHTTWKKFIYYCRFHGGFLNPSGQKMEAVQDAQEDDDDGAEEKAATNGDEEDVRRANEEELLEVRGYDTP